MHWPLRVDRTWDYQSCYLDLCSMIKNHSFEYRGFCFWISSHDSSPMYIYIYSMDKNTLLHSCPLTLMFNHNHLYQLAYHVPPRFCKLFHYNSSNAKWPDTSPGLVVNFDDFVKHVGALTSTLNELLPFRFRIMIITYTQHVWRQTINNRSPDCEWTLSLPLRHSNLKTTFTICIISKYVYIYI